MTIGAEGYIGFGVQSSATGVVVPTLWFPSEAWNAKKNPKRIERKATQGTLGKLPSLPGNYDPEGVCDTSLFASLAHPLFWIAGGAVATASVATGSPVVNKFTADIGSSPTYLTVLADLELGLRQQVGARLNNLVIDCPTGDEASLKFTWLGLTHTDGASATGTVAYPSDDPLTSISNTITIDGAADSTVDNVSLTINPNIMAKHANGQAAPATVRRGNIPEITGKIGFFDYPAAAYAKLAATTTFALILLFEGATITGAYKYYVKLTMSCCQWTGGMDKDITPAEITDEGDFEVLLNTSDSKIMTIEVQNSSATMPA